MKIGSKLFDLRTKINLSRESVANALGVSKSTIGHWETDSREPSFEMLDKLADIYGVTVSSIFSQNDVNTSDEKVDFLDRIILELKNEGILSEYSRFEDLDDSNKQILIGALNNHIKKLIKNPTIT